jgi:polyisoprenoid-binding protein YceI
LQPGRSTAVIIRCAALGASWILGVAPPNGKAEQLSVDLDPAKTQIVFTISDTLHTVHGNFRLKEGHFSFEPGANGMSGAIIVDAASGDSGSSARDRRMTRDILQAQRFPEIRFSPSMKNGSVAPSGASEIKVFGSFLIHGLAHEVTIPMQVRISGHEVVARGTFVIPYVEWGMKNPSNFLIKVKEQAEISLTAVGHTTPAEAHGR